jgi:hypothetical protein
MARQNAWFAPRPEVTIDRFSRYAAFRGDLGLNLIS